MSLTNTAAATSYFTPMTASLESAQAHAATAKKSGMNALDDTTPTTDSNASDDSVQNIGTTFLSLLATEMQNQDPTQPMSATDETGQMISLNELDQLVSINDVLTGSTTSATSSNFASSGAMDHAAASGTNAATGTNSTTGANSTTSNGSANGTNSAEQTTSADAQTAQANDVNTQAAVAAAGANSTTQPLDLGALMSLYGGKK